MKPFIVEKNVSEIAIGIVLLQDNCPFSFENKKLNFAHCNYLAYERKLFLIVYALKQWHHYLYGAHSKKFNGLQRPMD